VPNNQNRHQVLPDDSHEIYDNSISIQSSINIMSEDDDEEFDIYQRGDGNRKKRKQQRNVKSNKVIKRVIEGDDDGTGAVEPNVIIRKNTTVGKNRRQKPVENSSDFKNSSIGEDNSSGLTPQGAETAGGKGSNTGGVNTTKSKTGGEIMDKISSEKTSSHANKGSGVFNSSNQS
jgi:hypothetical protein